MTGISARTLKKKNLPNRDWRPNPPLVITRREKDPSVPQRPGSAVTKKEGERTLAEKNAECHVAKGKQIARVEDNKGASGRKTTPGKSVRFRRNWNGDESIG